MRLHWHPFSLFPRRVRVALLEKGLACEDVVVDLPGGATRTPAFRRLNPFGQVPVLEDDGLVLYESTAILEYLEERHPVPALLPDDVATRALARQHMCASGDYFAPALKRWLPRVFAPETTWDRADQEAAAQDLAAQLDVLDEVLAAREHLTGAFSLADVCYVPLVCDLHAVGLGHLVEARSNVRGWVARLNARPSVRATSPVTA